MGRIAKVATKRGLDEPDTSWIDYWRTRPVAERLAIATELSQECVDGVLSKDFVEFIECCVTREVKFLIVDGDALSAHGHPRATKDLDVSSVESLACLRAETRPEPGCGNPL